MMRTKTAGERGSRLGLLVATMFFLGILSWSALASAGWVKRYNGPGNCYDNANAIAVDSGGNVYVTGSSGDALSNYLSDYATIKYDANGNRKWVRRYDGPANSWDEAAAIAVDGVGNVYVTGGSYGSASDYASDYATIKYDANGNRKWVRRYNGPGKGRDEVTAMAVDSAGNVYVTGYSTGNTSDYDYATIKYDTNGNQKWIKRYNGAANLEDVANAIAVDDTGNVYVTGYSTGPSIYKDYITIKYDTNGNRKWVRRYNGPVNEHDQATAIAVDGVGNLYVTGGSYGTKWGDYDYLTIKYDTTGKQKWVRRYNGPYQDPIDQSDRATGIALDGVGNIYVTGSSSGTTSDPSVDDYATIKYDTNGNEKWVRRYSYTVFKDDEAKAIRVDSSGNVYVTGKSEGNDFIVGYDYATIKYDTNGNEKWVRRYNGPGTTYDYDDEANAIAIDSVGNVFVTGTSPRSTSGHDYLTIKYNADL